MKVSAAPETENHDSLRALLAADGLKDEYSSYIWEH